MLAKQRAPNAKIICVEPNPVLLPLLHQNVPDAEIIEAAIGPKPGTATLYTAPSSHQMSSVYKDSVTLFSAAVETISVPVVTLDDILPDGPIDLLKLDIQGAEYDALRNHAEMLDRVKWCICEFSFIAPNVLELGQLLTSKYDHYEALNSVAYGADLLFGRRSSH